jgi:hypothetical protein
MPRRWSVALLGTEADRAQDLLSRRGEHDPILTRRTAQHRGGQSPGSSQPTRRARPDTDQAHCSAQRRAGPRITSVAISDTAQHSTAQRSTAQHSAAQRSAAQHSTAQHSTAQHSAERSSARHARRAYTDATARAANLCLSECEPVRVYVSTGVCQHRVRARGGRSRPCGGATVRVARFLSTASSGAWGSPPRPRPRPRPRSRSQSRARHQRRPPGA